VRSKTERHSFVSAVSAPLAPFWTICGAFSMLNDPPTLLGGYSLNVRRRWANHFAPCLDLSAQSSPFSKNISVFQKLKLGYMICHPVPLRGALANVINAGRGCGGRGRRL
jgi:hypothetical protein